MKSNIILTGMMGAGKTYIGLALKKIKPDYNLIDIDALIEQNSNMKISEIFEKYSEEYFRKLETKTIQNICKNDRQIISLGGGAFEKPQNRTVLNNNGYTIYLKTSAEVLFNRIKSETHRPLLKQGFGVEKIAEILSKREENYKKARIVIDTTNKTSYNIIDEILKRIEEYAQQN